MVLWFYCFIVFASLVFFGQGTPGIQFAQTVRFLRFIVWPPGPLAHLKSFWLKIVLWFGAQVFSWLRFLSTESTLGARGPKRLQFNTTCFVHISQTIINTDSKLKLHTPICNLEFLAEVCSAFKSLTKP